MRGIIGRGGNAVWYKTSSSQKRGVNKEIKSPVELLISCNEPVADTYMYPEIVDRNTLHYPMRVIQRDAFAIGAHSLHTYTSYDLPLKNPLFNNYADGTIELYTHCTPYITGGRTPHMSFGIRSNYDDIPASMILIWLHGVLLVPYVFLMLEYEKIGQRKSGSIPITYTPNNQILNCSIPHNHIALTVKQRHITLWVNGLIAGEGDVPSDQVPTPSTSATITRKYNSVYAPDNSGEDPNDYILCGYRVTNGISLYNEPFTPNYQPFTRKAVPMYESG